MAPARSASRLPRVRTPMSSSSTPRAARVSTTCARRSSDAWGLPPTRGRFKVYIIDEVHMLSTAAFNALLKTLEEPPEHVVFVLCTTDPHKVPETIQSRCQRFDFRRFSVEEIVGYLERISKGEGLRIRALRRSSSSPRSPPAACVMPPRRSSRSASIPKARLRLMRPRACSVKSTLRHSSK